MRVSSPRWSLAVLTTLCAMACAPRGPGPLPAEARGVLDEVEQALARRDFASAHRHVGFRYRLEEMLGELWRSGPERAREDLVQRLAEMFDATSDTYRERFAGRVLERRVLRRQGEHLWVESRVTEPDASGNHFAWRYRLTPRGTTWAITQREFLVGGAPSDSTRYWPMAVRRITGLFGRPPTLSELAANLELVEGTMRVHRIQLPERGSPRPEQAPTTP